MDGPRAPNPAPDPAPRSWQFLYRTDAGRIDAATWWRGILVLAAIFAVLTGIYIYVRPYSEHDLSKTPLLSVSVLGANLYIVFYVFAVILIGICYYNLSAKRLRDRAYPPALAGLLPFLALLSAAFHWLSVRVEGALSPGLLLLVDLLLGLTIVWNVIDLGGLLAGLRRR